MYEAIMEELKSREVYMHEVYAPFYIASFVMHEFNLYNQAKGIYWVAKDLPNLRLHLLFVSPAGFMKTFFLEQFLRGNNAIFRHVVPCTFVSNITEAGLVGQVTNTMGDLVLTPGLAKQYDEGIVGVDEFSAITKAFQVSYGSQIETQLLSILDSGWVYKRVGPGEISYLTNMTLWGGVQPARFDLTSGMGRRFMYMAFFPAKKEADELMDAWASSKGKMPDNRTQEVKKKVIQFKEELRRIKEVKFSEELVPYYKKIGLFPYEGSQFDRLVMGLYLSLYGCSEVVNVEMTEEIEKIVKKELVWRRQISEGVEYRHIIKLLQLDGGKKEKGALLSDCIMLGWNMEKFWEVISDMRKHGMIKVIGNMIILADGW